MVCPTCKASIPDSSRFCAACGASTGSARIAVEEMNNPKHESKLAEANLYRIRSRWMEAETCCIEVLREDPNNIHAHSLLGDIFRDQGRYDDAAQWYRMALDLEPSSAADRAKLAYAEQQNARRSGKGSPTLAGLAESTVVGVGTQKLMGYSPVFWLRVLTVLSIVFMVAVVGMLFAMRAQPRTKTPKSSPTIQAGAGGSAASSIPAPMRANPGLQSGAYMPPAQPQPQMPAQPPTASSNSAFRAYEIEIQNLLAQPGILGPNTTPISVRIEPRGLLATITLSYTPGGPTYSPDTVRGLLVREALRGAQAAFGKNTTLFEAEMHILLATSGNRATPAFTGTIDRQIAQRLSAMAPYEQMLASFRNVTWSRELSPDAQDSHGAEGGTEF